MYFDYVANIGHAQESLFARLTSLDTEHTNDSIAGFTVYSEHKGLTHTTMNVCEIVYRMYTNQEYEHFTRYGRIILIHTHLQSILISWELWML